MPRWQGQWPHRRPRGWLLRGVRGWDWARQSPQHLHHRCIRQWLRQHRCFPMCYPTRHRHHRLCQSASNPLLWDSLPAPILLHPGSLLLQVQPCGVMLLQPSERLRRPLVHASCRHDLGIPALFRHCPVRKRRETQSSCLWHSHRMIQRSGCLQSNARGW